MFSLIYIFLLTIFNTHALLAAQPTRVPSSPIPHTTRSPTPRQNGPKQYIRSYRPRTPGTRPVDDLPHASFEAASVATQQDLEISILRRVRFEIVPLIHPFLRWSLVVEDRMRSVRYNQRAGLGVGVHVEMRTDQLPVPFA